MIQCQTRKRLRERSRLLGSLSLIENEGHNGYRHRIPIGSEKMIPMLFPKGKNTAQNKRTLRIAKALSDKSISMYASDSDLIATCLTFA